MSINFCVLPDVEVDENAVVIKEVRAFVIKSKEIEEKSGGCGDCHSHSDGHWIFGNAEWPIANPMSIYSKYKSKRNSWKIDALGSVVVQIILSNGVQGVGLSIGGEAACFIIEKHFSHFLIGQDPLNIEYLWDLMWRSSMNYGRKGLTIQSISAVDLALWDCAGKLRNEPIYKLLGGKTKNSLPCYATCPNPRRAKELKFHGAKFPLPFGPADGDRGLIKNLERIRQYRDDVGQDFPLMIDCYMSLNVNYTLQLLESIKPYGIKWFSIRLEKLLIEEHLPPDDYDGYAQVKYRNSTTILLTCGEHEYTRWGFKLLLERKCVDLLQPDVTWTGGLTETRRIVALASAFDVPIIPHGSSIYSYHLQYSFPNLPMSEFIFLSSQGDQIQPYFGDLFLNEPLPIDGSIHLDPHRAGFGVELNERNLRRPYDFSSSSVTSLFSS